jgi:dihydrolipoamide dehydrogenase
MMYLALSYDHRIVDGKRGGHLPRAREGKSRRPGADGAGSLNKIDWIEGTGSVLGEGKLAVKGKDGESQEIEAKNIVIASGSDVAGIPGVDVEFDEKVIVSSTGALDLEKVPGQMIVVGGGVIGLELGSVWARLGAKVTVIEFLDTILGGMDGEVAKQFQRMLGKQGLEFKLGAKVTGVDKAGKGAKVTFEPVKGGDAETLGSRCRSGGDRPQAPCRKSGPGQGRCCPR